MNDMTEDSKPRPPVVDMADCANMDRFIIDRAPGRLWYEGTASRVLVISFDNLATVDEGEDRGPWMHKRIVTLGYSNLGVQNMGKDWFRDPVFISLLKDLRSMGFFDQFEKIILMLSLIHI